MSNRSDKIGNAIAEAFGANPTDVQKNVWSTVCRVLEAYYEQKWIVIYRDPTVSPGIWQSGGDPEPNKPWAPGTMACQFDAQATDVLQAIWANVDGTCTGWSLVWSSDGRLDDHEVKATSTDTTHGALTDKIEAAGTLSKDIHTVAGKPIVRLTAPSFYIGVTRPPGAGSPGDPDDTTTIKGTHDHPPGPTPTPEAVSSTLYPAEIPGAKNAEAKYVLASLDRWADADATLIGGEQCGVHYPFDVNWTESPPGTWTRNISGELASVLIDDQTPTVGMRLFVGATSIATYLLPDCGIYEMLDTGAEQGGLPHYATIRRATDADASSDFTVGKPVHVLHGTTWGGWTFRYEGAANPTIGTSPLPFYAAGPTSAYASGLFGFTSRWHAIDGISTWTWGGETMSGADPVFPKGLASDGSPSISLVVGDKFHIWTATDTYGESAHFGLYEVLSIDAYGNPTIRRVIGANTAATLTGLIVAITGAGVAHAGNQFTETATVTTLDTSATAWTEATAASGSIDRLLTGTQCTQLGASSDVKTSTSTFQAGGANDFIFNPTTFTVGIGLDKFAAGVYTCTAKVRLDATPDAYTNIYLALAVRHADGSAETAFLVLSSPPLTSTIDQTVTFQGVLAADVSKAPDDELQAQFYGHTNSTTPVTITLTWQDPGRTTRITVPFAMSISGEGDGDHRHLSHCDLDVASSDPAKAGSCHPADAIGGGRLHRNIGAGGVSGGILTLPDNASQCRVSAPANIVGIIKDRFLDGDPIMVDFPDASSSHKVTLANMADVSSYPNASPMGLQSVGGVASGMEISGPTTVYFWFDQARTRWRFDRKTATT